MSSWQTRPSSTKADPMRPSLVERAKKRQVNEGKTPGVYIVVGNHKLGDQYPNYMVREVNGGWTCDCLSVNRTGGAYRSTCSHITGVLLHIEEHGPWRGPETEPEKPPKKKTRTKNGRVICDQCDLPFDTNNISDFRRVCPDCRRVEADLGEAARKESPPAPEFDRNHYPVKSTPKFALTEAPQPSDGFPDSSTADETTPALSATEVQLEGGKRLVPYTPLQPDELWDRINEDPEWIPHPGQVTTNASDPNLPDKFQNYREPQWRAIREIEEGLEEGYKVVFVSAPTGSGKTLIAESIRRFLGVRGIYTCTTKTLQDQILSEFDYAKVIKGRGNYPTYDDPSRTTLDCTRKKATLPACKNCPGWDQEKAGSSWDTHDMGDPTEEGASWHCMFCHPWDHCPYETAKMEAASARLAVLNTAYFLAETNFVNNSLFKGRRLVLIDEADMTEEELMRFIELTITAKDRKMLGVGLPEKKTVDESWTEWLIEEVVPAISSRLKEVNLSTNLFGEIDVDELKRQKKLHQLQSKIKKLLEEIEDEETGEKHYILNRDWVYTGYEKDMDGNYPPDNKVNVTFKPVHVKGYAQDIIWNKAQQFVLLSATMISPAMMAEYLGLDEDEWTVVEVPSSFPVLQRPIIPRMVANVIAKQMNEAVPKLISEIVDILEEHPDERVLIHSVSYRLTKDIFFELKHHGFGDRLATYFNSLDRQNALDNYLRIPNGVLVAPSFDRGVDLPADDCRVIIVAKIPFLSVGDKQVQARLFGTGKAGKTWYAIQAIRSLCQMTGRGMRSAEDSCRTYILDKQFSRLYNENRRLFPKWWADAIVWDVNDPKWKGMA